MVMKRSRSSSGTASSAACASTRRLNARMPSSRLRNCAGGGILRFIDAADVGFYRRPSAELCTAMSDSTRVTGSMLIRSAHGTPRHARRGRPRLEQLPPARSGAWSTARSTRSTRCARWCAWAAASPPTSASTAPRRRARSRRSRKFAERLRGFPRQAVRAVGTNALRVAKNAPQFLREARAGARLPDRGDLRPRGSAPHLPRRGARRCRVGSRPAPPGGRHRRRLDRVHHRHRARAAAHRDRSTWAA